MRKLLLVVPLLLAACGSDAASPAATGLPSTSSTSTSTSTTVPPVVRDDPPPGATRPDGHVAGHWAAQWPSPDGATLLGSWSGECESPSAWFGEEGKAWRPVVARPDGWPFESFAEGWSDDGRARVYFTEGLCGTAIERPGTYLVTTDGEATFLSPDGPDRFSGTGASGA